MNVQGALKSQYHAALAMLRQAIEVCPEESWTGGKHPIAFWHVAYHTLFFTHLYLSPDHESFRPWAKHREEYQFFDKLPWPPHDMPKIGEPYTKQQVLEFWAFLDGLVDAAVDGLDLEAPACGFPWYNLPKLDHQINNIRHLQHHTALLAGRVRQAHGKDVPWMGRVPDEAPRGGT